MPQGTTLPQRLAPPGAATARRPSTTCASQLLRRSRASGLRPGSSLPVLRATKNGGAPTALLAGP
eukprot:10144661-Lingulodinium_polyedra.AAC.1